MKLQYVSEDNLSIIKAKLPDIVQGFEAPTSSWLEQEIGAPLFIDSRLGEIPDFSLDTLSVKPVATDLENVKRVYQNLCFLTPAEAAEEGLWAALCLGPFYRYVKYRWRLNKECTVSRATHFFFWQEHRKGLFRNALSRLWWIGYLTYEEDRPDPWELTQLVTGEYGSEFVIYTFTGTSLTSPYLTHAILDAMLEAKKAGLLLDRLFVRKVMKYLHMMSGTVLLDCVPKEVFRDKIMAKMEELATQHNRTLEIRSKLASAARQVFDDDVGDEDARFEEADAFFGNRRKKERFVMR